MNVVKSVFQRGASLRVEFNDRGSIVGKDVLANLDPGFNLFGIIAVTKKNYSVKKMFIRA